MASGTPVQALEHSGRDGEPLIPVDLIQAVVEDADEHQVATDADLRAVINDPVRFARGLLRCDLWPVQAEILRAVATVRGRL